MMRLQDIGAAILKRLWIVIAILLVSALAAAIVSKVQSPVYKVEISASATAPINRTTGLPDAMTQGAYVALMPSVANFAESFDVARVVSERLEKQGIQISPEELLKKVSAMPEANSTSMKITFTDGSPTRVADIANTWGETMELMTLKSEANEFFNESLKNLILNGNIVFTNRAVVPEKPTQPKPMAYLGLGVFVGLVLGLVLVVLIEYFDPHFRSMRETEESLGLPVLGVLPKAKGAEAVNLLPVFGEGSLTWEAYAELRSAVILSHREEGASLVAAPAVPFPAAPAVVANLAMSIANTGRKALLVDADLRERSLSRFLGMEGRPGLSEVLEKGEDPRPKIIEGGAPNLFFLPAGKRSERSTDLLSSPAFIEELREQEEVFDQVVIYAPALQGSVDAAVVSSAGGNFLAMIDAERCTRKAAEEALRGIERVGIVPMGVVLANVRVKRRERGKGEPERPAATVKAGEKKAKKAKKAKPAGAPAAMADSGAPYPVSKRTVMEKPGDRATGKRPPSPATEPSKPRAEAPLPPAWEPAPEGPAPRWEESPSAREESGRAAAAGEVVALERGGVETPATGAGKETSPGAARTWRRAEKVKAAAPEVEAKAPPPEASSQVGLHDEARARERVLEEFRRKGERGEPIPKTWLRGLNSDKPDVRESAAAAITEYYHAFLRRYGIGEESVREIAVTIIRMMRREGEFAAISEAEAQERLRRMLAEAGARVASGPSEGGSVVGKGARTAPSEAGLPGKRSETATAGAPESAGARVATGSPAEEKADQATESEGLGLPEKRRFRISPRSEGKAARKRRGKEPMPDGGDEDVIDWE